MTDLINEHWRMIQTAAGDIVVTGWADPPCMAEGDSAYSSQRTIDRYHVQNDTPEAMSRRLAALRDELVRWVDECERMGV